MNEVQQKDRPVKSPDLGSLLHLSHPSKPFKAFAEKLVSLSSPVDRLKITFDFMRECLSEGFAARRAEFWQAKQISLVLFKEPIEAAFRYPLWQQFIEVLDSAELAREVIAENSSFYFEQFALALKDLEIQVTKADEALACRLSLLDKLGFDGTSHAMEEFVQGLDEELVSLQGRLERFHQFASRYRSLREEIIDCVLNPSDKRELLSHLKQIKEKIFPPRADLVAQVDTLYDNEVSHFVTHALLAGEPVKPIYVLKQQLKALQRLAKTLSLSSKAFKNTRLKLSELWDLLSELEDAQREKMREQRAQCQLNAAHVQEKIEHLKNEIHQLNYEQMLSRTKQIIRFMHGMHLMREDKKHLRESLEQLKEPFLQQINEGLAKQNTAHEEQANASLRAFQGLINQIGAIDPMSDTYFERRAIAEEKAGRLEMTSGQLREVQMRLDDLENEHRKVLEKEIRSSGDPTRLDEYRLKEKERLRAKLDMLKKEKAAAGIDFERGFALEEQIAAIKQQLQSL